MLDRQSWSVETGDCAAVMAAMPEGSVDAVVCDPPYGLGFMGKDWDSPGGHGNFPSRRTQAANTVNTGASRQGGRQRASEDWHKRQGRDARSYQEWCETWGREALRVLRPGGYILAFGGTRTYHRLASGLEDAGFEVRDMIAWLYGSGFPKHASCLKPAQEPVMLGRKAAPKSEPLQIDACRIEGDVPSVPQPVYGVSDDGVTGFGSGVGRNGEMSSAPGGRWPANVALDEEAARALDEQTGTLTSGSGQLNRNADKFRTTYGEFKGGDEPADVLYGDSGGASRFLYVAKPSSEERNRGLDGFEPRDDKTTESAHSVVCAKCGRQRVNVSGECECPDPEWTRVQQRPARNPHPTVKPVTLMRWLIRLITPPGGLVLDPFMGSGTTGIAAMRESFSFIGIDQDADYVDVARARIIGDAPLLNGALEEAA